MPATFTQAVPPCPKVLSGSTLVYPTLKHEKFLKNLNPGYDPAFYTVVELISNVTCRIQRVERIRPKVVHVNRLWKYHRRGQYTWDQHHQEPETAGSSREDKDTGSPDIDAEED